jgi:hypothetical protein
MAVVNASVSDITADVALATSKPKIKDNFDDLLANDVAIEARETVLEGGSFVGASRWDDIIVPCNALIGGASAPDLTTFQGTIQLYTFDGGSTTEEVMGVIELPHDYKEGTDLRPHIHWSPSNTAGGNVKWQLTYTRASKDGTFPATSTISVTAAVGTTALVHLANEFTVITGTGFKIGDIIAFRLFRDPTDVADTYGSDAFLLSLGIHYKVDSTGSVNVFTKT